MKLKMLLALLLAVGCSIHAQTSSSIPSGAGARPSNDPFRPPNRDDLGMPGDLGISPYVRHRMEEARKIERKKRMVDTANRLLVLTKQLQADLQGRQPTPDDEKRLDEIARLARTVKDQMRQ